MNEEEYLDRALKYAVERYDERHYDDEDTMDTFSDWGVDYEGWSIVWRRALWNLQDLQAIHRGDRNKWINKFARNPLNLAALDAARVLVKEKGL